MKNLNHVFLLPGLISVKDSHSKYLSMSRSVAELVGWDDPKKSVDQTDYDLPSDVSAYAENFIKLDKQAFALNKTLISIESYCYQSQWKTLLAERKIIFNDTTQTNQLWTHCTDITHTAMARNSIFLCQADKKIVQNAYSYIINHDSLSVSLTDRQKTCLFFLIRGKTVKQIAATLGLSKRTVEEHITIIKNKFNCHSKSQLIEKAIDNGFLFSIPSIKHFLG